MRIRNNLYLGLIIRITESLVGSEFYEPSPILLPIFRNILWKQALRYFLIKFEIMDYYVINHYKKHNENTLFDS